MAYEVGYSSYNNVFNILNERPPTQLPVPPILIAVGTLAAVIAIKVFLPSITPRKNESYTGMIGRWARNIPAVEALYQKDIHKQRLQMAEKTREQWIKFGTPFKEIPENGLPEEEIKKILAHYTEVTEEEVHDKHFSGTVYQMGLTSRNPIMVKTAVPEPRGQQLNCKDLVEKIQRLCSLAFFKTQLWNTLHADEFGVGYFIEFQAVQMVGNLFGAIAKEIMGFITSGGTESIMNAVKMYRNWARETKGHRPGETVIIAPDTIHASLKKGCDDYDVNWVVVPTDASGKMDPKALKAALDKHGNKVAAIFVSAPSYPTGKIDDIAEAARLAQQYECGLHVDCCLGGFIINFDESRKTDFLAIPGVTSLSVDTHKNGLAPKGTSVLITRPIGKASNVGKYYKRPNNLARHSIHVFPNWKGGVYGTPKQQGSQPVAPALQAFFTMLAVGKAGYRTIAQQVLKKTKELAQVIDSCPGLKRIGDPEVNVVAFKMDPALNLEYGATYAFAHEMKKRKFVLNTISGDTVHFCATMRFAGDPDALKKFKAAALESIEAVKELNEQLKFQVDGKKLKFPGDAGIYGALEAAMNPVASQQGIIEYLKNRSFGKSGADDAVREYFLAHLNPYADGSYPTGWET